jgi:ribonuclease-3
MHPVETRLAYTFHDGALLELALTHASAGVSTDRGRRDNERLEFLGDTVLDLVVAEELYSDEERHAEGKLTEMKSAVVSRKALADAARRLDLALAARLGRGLAQREPSRAILANLFEAIVGAIYLDGGLEPAREFVLRTLAVELEEARARKDEAVPKQGLQEWCQREYGVPPTYELVERRGDDHTRAFLVRARVDGRTFPPAWGRTMKEAESWAAYEALMELDAQDAATATES